MKISWVLATLMIWPCSGLAADDNPAGRLQGQIGLSVMNFGYKEFNDGRRLDREDGLLPGIAGAITRRRGDWFGSWEASYHTGNVLYDGQTQSGLSLRTRTDEELMDLALQIGHGLRAGKYPANVLYAGLGYHRWKRDIRSTSDVTGLFEVYDWWYGILGLKGTFYSTDKIQWGADLRLIRTITPKIIIDFKGLYDRARLNLDERFGGRLSLPWRYQYRENTAFDFEPYLESWNLGRSPTKLLTRNGAVVGSVFEPKSETRNYGLTIGIIRFF
ncbi:MAG: hypothetical protein HY204_02750 [Nitrospirae bacterium]|nr:hypothetical protein [Nitrospirota bacterium]